MAFTFALAGNPNTGKTTLFNSLTGSEQYVGNWPGVTVEKKEGVIRGLKGIRVQDLPGVYSLSPYSIEERVTREYLVEQAPDAILNIVDGTNLERNLYFSTQLAELGLPMVMAVNMMDVVKRHGDWIDFEKIGRALKCDVVGISAASGEGTRDAVARLVKLQRQKCADEVPHVFSGSVEHAIAHIEESIEGAVSPRAIRWYAIKVFERDQEIVKKLKLSEEVLEHIDEHIRDCEKELEDTSESIITNQRYAFIKALVRSALKRKEKRSRESISDRVDRLVTHKIWGLPIFFLFISAMWYLAVAEKGPGTLLTDWANDVFLARITEWMTDGLTALGVSPFVISLVVDGAWGGVATVLGFVPVITICFCFLAIMEDCGYMARVAFVIDRFFRLFGLSGKSFIPLIIGKGCGVPAVMAARAIENERDRRMTIILATFMPCGAKTVIIALFSSIFFRDQWYIAALMDVIAIGIIFFGGIALKKSRLFSGEVAPFIMEMPAYHLPTIRGVLIRTGQRVKSYIVKAGLVIFPICVFLWLVMHVDWSFNLLAETELDRSILHSFGQLIAGLFAPLGFGTWQGAVATIAAEFAKEQATAVLTMFAGGEESDQMMALFRTFSDFPRLSALSFMIFNLFIPPCIVAVVVSFRELCSKKWGFLTLAFQLFVGYSLALSVYQIGLWICTGHFGFWTAVALAIDLFCLWAVVRPVRKEAKESQK